MLRVRLLGDLAIEVDGTAVEPPASRRARALLGWLALDPRMHSRSRLAAQFWPDVLDESARTSLRSALSALRRALGPESERYLTATRDEVGLADGSLVWTDVAEFKRCVKENRLQDALALGRGELLSGLEDDWVYEHRDEHRDRVAGVLARLAAGAEQDGDLRSAIDYTRRQAALDPLAEQPQRDLMRRLAAAGDRSAAIRAYERLSRRLREELRLAPAQETRELAAGLRAGGETARPVVGAWEPAAAAVTPLFTGLVGSREPQSEPGDDETEQLWPERRIALPPSFVGEEHATLVGRDAQLERLRRLWQDARAGRRQIVVLVGEPGIGKTRLAAEFCRGAYVHGALVLLGRCYEDSLVPYQPVVEAVRHYVSESPPEALRPAVARHRATLAKLLPEFADGSSPAAAIRSGTEPLDREQVMLFEGMASVLRTA
jgi:DNA-binding SARP family transcriptional activator